MGVLYFHSFSLRRLTSSNLHLIRPTLNHLIPLFFTSRRTLLHLDRLDRHLFTKSVLNLVLNRPRTSLQRVNSIKNKNTRLLNLTMNPRNHANPFSLRRNVITRHRPYNRVTNINNFFPRLTNLYETLTTTPTLMRRLTRRNGTLNTTLFNERLVVIRHIIPTFLNRNVITNPRLHFTQLVNIITNIRRAIRGQTIRHNETNPQISSRTISTIQIRHRLRNKDRGPFHRKTINHTFVNLYRLR